MENTKATEIMAQGKINRPMNCFMIYKRDKKHAILASNPMINFRDISKIVADQWRGESQQVKDHYKNLAKIEMKNHQEKYPDYRFPSSKGKHGKKRARGLSESCISESKQKKPVGRPRKDLVKKETETPVIPEEKNDKLQEYIARLKNVSGITFQKDSIKDEGDFSIPDRSEAIYKDRVLPPLIQNRAFAQKVGNNSGYLITRGLPNIGSLPLITVNGSCTIPKPVQVSQGGSVLPQFIHSRDLLIKKTENVKEDDVKQGQKREQQGFLGGNIQRMESPSTPIHNPGLNLVIPKPLMNTPESSPLNSVQSDDSELLKRPVFNNDVSSFNIETQGSSNNGNSLYFSDDKSLPEISSLSYPYSPANPAKRGRPRGIDSPVKSIFQCEICSSTFVRRHDLKRHLLLHTGLGPYRCSCGRHFNRQDFFSRHMVSCRLPVGQSPPDSPVKEDFPVPKPSAVVDPSNLG